MQFARPTFDRPVNRPLRIMGRAPTPGLAGLGDDLSGAIAVPNLISKLKLLIINKAGNLAGGAIVNNTSLPAVLYAAADYYGKGNAGQLYLDAQTAWNAWRAQAEPLQSNNNISWVFARCVNRWGQKLIAAANDQAASGMLTDQAASKATFTLMDTTQQGTTWYGGTVTTSKLDNGQWGSVFENAFSVIAKGISDGVLPFTYLEVLVSAMCVEPAKRRFPVWSPPYSGMTQNDPRGAAFRTAMKQLGWTAVVKMWAGYTQQAWADQSAAAEAQDAALMGVITGLNFISGKAIYDQVVAKVGDYFKARGDAVEAIRSFKQMQTGPLAEQVPAADVEAMEAIIKQFAATDNSAYDTIKMTGLWPSDTSAGVAGLGAVQYAVGGVVAIGILGMLVWAIALMTETSRTAAAQTAATAKNILASVDAVKASCIRSYQASDKGPAAEKAYQDCLLATKTLTDSIPTPPSGSDPLGMKWMAMLGVVAIGGFLAWKQFGKK